MSNPGEAITALGRGVFRIVGAERQSLAYAVIDGARTWIFIDGQTFIVEPPRARRGTAAADDQSLAAPMPATVTKIHVSAGQTVEAGDVLVTLEAMKMELAIKSPRTGRVKTVNCTQGQLVQPGVALATLTNPEPEPEPRTENREA